MTSEDVDAEAHKIYSETQQRIDGAGGMVKPAHILILLKQKATKAEQEQAKLKADSIYKVLLKGADFSALAKNILMTKVQLLMAVNFLG